MFKYGNVSNHKFVSLLSPKLLAEIKQFFFRTSLKHLLLKEFQHLVLIQHSKDIKEQREARQFQADFSIVAEHNIVNLFTSRNLESGSYLVTHKSKKWMSEEF